MKSGAGLCRSAVISAPELRLISSALARHEIQTVNTASPEIAGAHAAREPRLHFRTLYSMAAPGADDSC